MTRPALPAVVMTGHGDVSSAREAFRANAIDFLEKPVDHGRLIGAIAKAFSRQAATGLREHLPKEFNTLLQNLASREREVMDLVRLSLSAQGSPHPRLP